MTGGKEYALALFSLTEELGIADAALGDVEICKRAFDENPSYVKLCDTPSLPISEKLELITSAFATVAEPVKNLLCILCEKHSVSLFSSVAKEFVALYNESRGIIVADAISAVPLSAAQISAIKKKLEAMTGKTVKVNNTVDKSMISGMRLRYMGTQLDGSLISRLEAIEKNLKNTIV